MALDGTNVEEVLAVPTEGVPGRLVDRLQVVPQGLDVRAEESAKVTTALLREENRQVATPSPTPLRRDGRPPARLGQYHLVLDFGLWAAAAGAGCRGRGQTKRVVAQ